MSKEKFVIASKQGHGYVADHKKTKSSASYTKSLGKALVFPTKSAAESDAAIDERVLTMTEAKEAK